MSHHADSDGSLKSPRIWCTEDFRALDAVRVRKSEVVYAFVSLGGKPSVMDEAVLDAMERGRARRFMRRTDCHRFILAHAALRLFLAGCLGAEPTTVRYESGVSGKPRLAAGLAPLEFNLSHSEELALVAVARQRAVGVDVERLRDVPEALGIADVYFSRPEREELHSLRPSERREAFLRCWTRKEAVTKASGEGLGTPIDSSEVDLAVAARSALKRYAANARKRFDGAYETSSRPAAMPPPAPSRRRVRAVRGRRTARPTSWRRSAGRCVRVAVRCSRAVATHRPRAPS